MNTEIITEKFTPGPWQVSQYYPIGILNKDGHYIADCAYGAKKEQAEFNAKLIAAAPDLLQVCSEMIKHLTETDFDVCGTPDELLNKWKAAIKKATE